MDSIAPHRVVGPLLLLLAPAIGAQQHESTAGDADLFLDAGQHPLEAVLNRAAAALGERWRYDLDELELQPNRTLVLQTPLRLHGHEIAVVVSELAFSKGFAMVPSTNGKDAFEWLATTGRHRDEILARPLTRTPEQVVADRRWVVPVETVVTLVHLDPNRAQNQLRPFFSGNLAPSMLHFAAADGGIRITGLAPQVARAIELLRAAERTASASPPDAADGPPWSEGIEQRLDRLERRLGGGGAATKGEERSGPENR